MFIITQHDLHGENVKENEHLNHLKPTCFRMGVRKAQDLERLAPAKLGSKSRPESRMTLRLPPVISFLFEILLAKRRCGSA